VRERGGEGGRGPSVERTRRNAGSGRIHLCQLECYWAHAVVGSCQHALMGSAMSRPCCKVQIWVGPRKSTNLWGFIGS
jgi:hypothetical protein